MIDSLLSHDPTSKVGILCHDRETFTKLSSLDNSRILVRELQELVIKFPEIAAIKFERSKLEFIYALTPFVVDFFWDWELFESITYVDADLFFYKSPEELLSETINSDVAIIGHRFHEKIRKLEFAGKYNVGLVHFNYTSGSRGVLEYWKKACIKSTSIHQESDIYGDQKYLESFHQFGKVYVIDSAGANAAPWNCREIHYEKNSAQLIVNGENLIFFHFSGLKIFRNFATLSYLYYEWSPGRNIKKYLYLPYIKEIIRNERILFAKITTDSRKITFRQMLRFISKKDIVLFRMN